MLGGHDKIWMEGQIKGEYHFLKESDHPLVEISKGDRKMENELKFSRSSFLEEDDSLSVGMDETFDSNYMDYSFGEEQEIAAFDLTMNGEEGEDTIERWVEPDTSELFSDDLTPRTDDQLFTIARPKSLDTGLLYRKPIFRDDFLRLKKNTNSPLTKKFHSDEDSHVSYEIEYQSPASTEENPSLNTHRRSESFDPNRYSLPDDYLRNIINRKKHKEREDLQSSKDSFHTHGKSDVVSERQSLVVLPLKPGHQSRPKKPPPPRVKKPKGKGVNRNQPVAIIINKDPNTKASISLTGTGKEPHAVSIHRRPIGPPRYNHKIFKLPVIDRTAIILFLVFIAALSVGPLVQILFAGSQGKRRNKDAKASLMHREDDESSPLLELHRQVQAALDSGDELYGRPVRSDVLPQDI